MGSSARHHRHRSLDLEQTTADGAGGSFLASARAYSKSRPINWVDVNCSSQVVPTTTIMALTADAAMARCWEGSVRMSVPMRANSYVIPIEGGSREGCEKRAKKSRTCEGSLSRLGSGILCSSGVGLF